MTVSIGSRLSHKENKLFLVQLWNFFVLKRIVDFKNYIASNQQISFVRSRVVDRRSVAFTLNI